MSLLKSRPDVITMDPSARTPRTKAATPALQEQLVDSVRREGAEYQENVSARNARVNGESTRAPESRRISSIRLFGWLSGDSR